MAGHEIGRVTRGLVKYRGHRLSRYSASVCMLHCELANPSLDGFWDMTVHLGFLGWKKFLPHFK